MVFVGGEGTNSDLYAIAGVGGPAIAITFSPVSETRPALAPDGGRIAFLRAGALRDSTPASAWVLDLADGAERRVELPEGAGPPDRIGWERGGRGLVVRAGGKLYRAEAPLGLTAGPVAATGRAVAESALAVVLGEPPFAEAVSCENPADLCVVAGRGPAAVFAPGARDPARWGDDSVAYLEDARLVVRPVGAGRPRIVHWSRLPARPRQLTAFAGASGEPR